LISQSRGLGDVYKRQDITYRIYDFDRVDAHGNTRELHNDLALEAINYEVVDAQRVYETVPNCSNTIVDCPYFTTNVIELDGTMKISKSTDSFTVYMCVGGQFELTLEGEVYPYTLGDTILIPAFLTDFQLNGLATVLEIYIS
jgi:mannose-6-phosphate isomerase